MEIILFFLNAKQKFEIKLYELFGYIREANLIIVEALNNMEQYRYFFSELIILFNNLEKIREEDKEKKKAEVNQKMANEGSNQIMANEGSNQIMANEGSNHEIMNSQVNEKKT